MTSNHSICEARAERQQSRQCHILSWHVRIIYADHCPDIGQPWGSNWYLNTTKILICDTITTTKGLSTGTLRLHVATCHVPENVSQSFSTLTIIVIFNSKFYEGIPIVCVVLCSFSGVKPWSVLPCFVFSLQLWGNEDTLCWNTFLAIQGLSKYCLKKLIASYT